MATLRIDEMTAAVARGEAERLFADDPIGPAHYHGAWWAIPEAKVVFEVVCNPAVAAGLDQVAARIGAAGGQP